MSWTVILEIIGAIAAVGLAIYKAWAYYRGKRDAEHTAMMKSAEEYADSTRRVLDEARKTAYDVESVGPDTPVAVGNELLSGQSE